MLNEEIGQRHLNFESYKERITNFSNEFDLGLFIYIVKRSLIWITLCILLAISAAYLYLRYTAPTYDSKTLLQISQSNNAQKVLEVKEFIEDNSLLATVELLRSKFFIAKAVQKLPLQVSYFYRGQVLTKEFYTQTFFEVKDLEIYDPEIKNQPVFIDITGPSAMALNYTIGEQSYSEDIKVGQPFRTAHFGGRVVVLDDRLLLETDPDGRMYFVINTTKSLVNRYSDQLSVRVVDPDAQTIEITCLDNNPVLARDLASMLAETFIEYDLQRKSESAESILRFIESQKDTVFEKLRRSEYLLQSFKQDNKVANMEELMPLYLERANDYENELLKAQIERRLLEEIEKATLSGRTEVFDLIPLIVGTEYERTLSELIRDLQEMNLERQELTFEITDVNDALISLDRQIEVQKRLIIASVQSLRNRLIEKEREYEQIISDIEGRFTTLPEKELEYSRIERIFLINEKYYTQLLEKDIEYRISRAGFVPDNRILEEASVATSPITPKRNMVLLSYLMTGVVLSFLVVLVRYILHDNITSLNDIAKLSNASIGILGMVPKYKKDIPISQLLVDKNPKSLIAESFRSIRTNLQFVDNTPGAKIIAITSTISGEGKTFVAINLAGIIAFSGKRVIIIDLDMRKPKIHLGMSVENIRGMSSLLIDRDTIDNCIQHSTLSGLDFITAGPIPPNPSELIISPRMQEILEELKRRYDIILIDNPPVGLVTDGIAMIQLADYPIYIFRADYSKKVFVQNVDRLINENKITRLSTILNGVDIDRNKYGYNYGYGYGYGYGQGYGYGYYEDKPQKRRRGPA